MKKELHPESDAIALRSLEVGAPVRLRDDGWNSFELPSGLEAPCLSVPVRSGVPEATAVVLLGPHQTGNDINAEECEMLERLAARVGAAYERVVTDMLRKEVVQLKAQLVVLQGGNSVKSAGS